MGFNSIWFDDEVFCYLFYRNFYDLYLCEWWNGNSCWDIIDLVWVCYVLRFDGINWLCWEDGVLSFKLEVLIVVNNIGYENVYDVLSDVYVIIVFVKLIKEK